MLYPSPVLLAVSNIFAVLHFHPCYRLAAPLVDLACSWTFPVLTKSLGRTHGQRRSPPVILTAFVTLRPSWSRFTSCLFIFAKWKTSMKSWGLTLILPAFGTAL